MSYEGMATIRLLTEVNASRRDEILAKSGTLNSVLSPIVASNKAARQVSQAMEEDAVKSVAQIIADMQAATKRCPGNYIDIEGTRISADDPAALALLKSHGIEFTPAKTPEGKKHFLKNLEQHLQ